MTLPTSLKEAIASGAQRYFTGKPCKRGHVALRFSWGGCTECVKLANAAKDKEVEARKRRESRALDPTKHRESVKKNRERNPEKVKGRVQKWRAENKEHLKSYRKKYYMENAQTLRDLRRENYHKNPELWAERHLNWARSNPEKAKERAHRRRALKLGSSGTVSAREIKELKVLQRGKCANCQEKKKLTIDHIIPLSKGGANSRKNIQMLCLSCNSAKRDHDPIDFAQRLGRLL